ncbi:MAG TPA: hypothetical protein VGH44_00685 [Candidatus Saccharimonadia bacterium]|jgi:hypothetical protein
MKFIVAPFADGGTCFVILITPDNQIGVSTQHKILAALREHDVGVQVQFREWHDGMMVIPSDPHSTRDDLIKFVEVIVHQYHKPEIVYSLWSMS